MYSVFCRSKASLSEPRAFFSRPRVCTRNRCNPFYVRSDRKLSPLPVEPGVLAPRAHKNSDNTIVVHRCHRLTKSFWCMIGERGGRNQESAMKWSKRGGKRWKKSRISERKRRQSDPLCRVLSEVVFVSLATTHDAIRVALEN